MRRLASPAEKRRFQPIVIFDGSSTPEPHANHIGAARGPLGGGDIGDAIYGGARRPILQGPLPPPGLGGHAGPLRARGEGRNIAVRDAY